MSSPGSSLITFIAANSVVPIFFACHRIYERKCESETGLLLHLAQKKRQNFLYTNTITKHE